MVSRESVWGLAVICLLSTAATSRCQDISLVGLGAEVTVEVDSRGIPHIYAKSWPDAARTLGYLHATDRLWQMDMLRRQASGTMSAVLGRGSIDSDILMRRLGLRRSCEALWTSGELPSALRAELEAYAGGVNARMAQLDKNPHPVFAMLGYKPEPWTPVDSLVFSKYMAWDQSGTDDDLWFGMMVEKLPLAAIEELWPLDRPYEVPTVKSQASLPFAKPQASLHGVPGAAAAYEAALHQMSKVRGLGRGLSFGSNNWAVDGTKTASHKPILCNDPHLGFSLPSIWYACHECVAGENLAGVTFPGGPVVIIGHNDHIGWGLTNLQADAVDYFVETVDPQDPLRYQHRGEWKKMERVTEQIPVRGEAPQSLDIDMTVHGPLITREGRAIAMSWTALPPTRDAAALWGVSRAKNLQEFLSALDDLTAPALNVVYADVQGNIAMHPCGALPLRMRGQGRIPMDGASGDNDWTGMIPRGELPLAVNPAEHFVASANGRPTPLGYPHYLGWMWDCNYRIRRINDMLAGADALTVDSMQVLQLDAYDKAAERFLPTLLRALAPPNDESPARRAAEELKNWNYVAGVDAIGPVIWLRWFRHYRAAVWDDEWTARGIKQPEGSWGFSGTNHREPMLEVLEYMTRENPQAVWFDDRATAERETRDDIARRTFGTAVESLVKDYGPDVQRWRWGNINQLQISSLSRQPSLAREGGPVVGTCFTVNPGSDVGAVGGGASWRMIVDLARTDRSLGVYPGGQSEHPNSPLYGDQIALWAHGQYLPLHAIGDRTELARRTPTTTVVFKP